MEPIKISDELKIISGNALRIHLPSDRTIDSSTVKQACDTVKTFKITKDKYIKTSFRLTSIR